MRALAHLQEKRIMHRDIKSSNVLVTNSLVLKLADFGMARQVPEGAEGALLVQSGQQLHPAAAALSFSGSSPESFSMDYTNNVITMKTQRPIAILVNAALLFS